MLKKVLVVGAGLLLLLGLFTVPYTRSHLMTAWQQGKEFVNEAEPIEHQLDRAEVLIRDIDPEIKRCVHLVAKAEVDIDNRREELAVVENQLVEQKEDMDRLKAHLDNGGGTFYVGTDSYPESRVRQDLRLRFEKYKTSEATRDKLESLLDSREEGLEAAQKKLGEMRSAKDKLEVEVASLKARLELVRAAETKSNINIDDSHLSQTKEFVDSIKSRIDVAEKMVHADTDDGNLIPLEEEDQEVDSDISKEIAEYFNNESDGGTIDLRTASK
jgi:chromosome segregation ATPase